MKETETHEVDMPSNTRLLFVYGTLKQGGRLNNVLARTGSQYVGIGRILSKDFVLRNLGGFPALQSVTASSGTYIVGELWLVPKNNLHHIDKVEGYPRLYSRTDTTVWMDEGKFTATTYYMAGPHETKNANNLAQFPVIESGEWDANANKPLVLEEKVPMAKGKLQNSDFKVERGIYIISEWGEMFGPYDDIEKACENIETVANEIGQNVRLLTVGFRALRTNLTEPELSDVATVTVKL